MTHEEYRDLLAGYALHALDPEDARALEAHLAGCAACRDELARLEEGAAALAADVPPAIPPESLRNRVLAALDAGDLGRATGEHRLSPAGGVAGRRGLPRAWTAALAAAAALIVVLGGAVVSLEQRLAALDARLAEERSLTALLTDPATRMVSLSGAEAGAVRLVFDPKTRRGALVASGLRDPGAGRVYQLWLISGQTPESAGVFRPGADQAVIVPVAADFTRYQVVAITTEQGPRGAPRPTSTPILLAKFPPAI